MSYHGLPAFQQLIATYRDYPPSQLATAAYHKSVDSHRGVYDRFSVFDFSRTERLSIPNNDIPGTSIRENIWSIAFRQCLMFDFRALPVIFEKIIKMIALKTDRMHSCAKSTLFSRYLHPNYLLTATYPCPMQHTNKTTTTTTTTTTTPTYNMLTYCHTSSLLLPREHPTGAHHEKTKGGTFALFHSSLALKHSDSYEDSYRHSPPSHPAQLGRWSRT